MCSFWDFALDIAGKINDTIYYDHVGSSANKPIFGNPIETVSETLMAGIAEANGSEEAAKHHAIRAIVSATKSIVKY